MNLLIRYEDLPDAEREVADLYAYGLTKKEIANVRGRSVRTVENQIRKLFQKTEVRKDTEFTRWYFCTRFKITFDLSPVMKSAVSFCLLALMFHSIYNDNNYARYRMRTRTQIEEIVVRREH